jgi:SAM-dependent methyltransferase
MADISVWQRSLNTEIIASGGAPDLAGAAALLDIGDSLGLVGLIDTECRADVLAAAVDLPVGGVVNYLEALAAAGIVERVGDLRYRPSADFAVIRHQAGYISWAMTANRPFIEHAREFLTDPEQAKATYRRNGRQVAVSSQWMGSLAFYPAAKEAILQACPTRFADLGSGTCRLVIEVLLSRPDATGVGLDIDAPACDAARSAAKEAGLADRIDVYQRPIQSLAADPSPLEGVDVIHGGFVFHDMLPDEEDIADKVLARCRDALPVGGTMAITDAVPFPASERERRFGTIVSYYHHEFMGRRLLSAAEWCEKLKTAGFADVKVIELGFPSGRLFIARR